MNTNPDIDFEKIAPRCGSRDSAFEELCCQMARASVENVSAFRRIRGDGGDGGVECIWVGPAGEVHGWQVKFIFDYEQAIKKVGASLDTALANFPTLSRYVICLPFDLSGSKGKSGKSQLEKFAEFKRDREQQALAKGRNLVVELWDASHLRDALAGGDGSGGRTRFWFDSSRLGGDWFSGLVDAAVTRAGPRYQPELHHGHALDEVMSAIGSTPAWLEKRAEWADRMVAACVEWPAAYTPRAGIEPFADTAKASALRLTEMLRSLCEALKSDAPLLDSLALANEAGETCTMCVDLLAADIDARFGAGSSRSVRFRQFQAEYQCCFPARHLDYGRDLLTLLRALAQWLGGASARASAERVLLIHGPAGIGKTHGLCDAARKRTTQGLPTVVLMGSQFRGQGTWWELMRAGLGLDGSWSQDALLDALESAGAALGSRVVIAIDALDESVPRQRWLEDLPLVAGAVASVKRPHLALCVSVRDGYQRQVLRDGLELPTFSHPGFGGSEFDACTAFFTHFGLEPPVGPLLAPEFGNPLFLNLLCQALTASGLTRIPAGWSGSRRILGALLTARDRELRVEAPGVGARAVTNALLALANEMRDGSPLPWSVADATVQNTLPVSQRGAVDLLNRLLGLNLIRTQPGAQETWGEPEDAVDIAFGRLRHHLVGEAIVGSDPIDREALLRVALDDPGLAEALAIALPEQGVGELPDFARSASERGPLLASWCSALGYRATEALSERTEQIVLECLGDGALVPTVLDSLQMLSMRPGHRLDWRFLHGVLMRQPLGRRDAVFCHYLHDRYNQTSPPSVVQRLLRAAWQCDVSNLPSDVRRAWLTLLCWFTSAADRRVRDAATKTAVRLSETDPAVWSEIIPEFYGVDDDYVLERVLCAAYGAVLRNPDAGAIGKLVLTAAGALENGSAGRLNVSIRDHVLCICAFARHRGAMPAAVPSGLDKRSEEAPIDWPTESDVAALKSDSYPQLHASCASTWTGDFVKYTVPRALGALEERIDAEAAGRWVLRHVVELGYEPELHADYDYAMLNEHGGGRGRPGWAERIGKKYQNIALRRLVGRLNGNGPHREEVGEERLFGEPLRDLDPSVLARGCEERVQEQEPWWTGGESADFGTEGQFTDEEWVERAPFPDIRRLVQVRTEQAEGAQQWRLLEGHFTWSNRKSRDEDRYRYMWMTVRGYLLPRSQLKPCWKVLRGEDFMGNWMPDGFEAEVHGYFGEYPWGYSFSELLTQEEWDTDRDRMPYDVSPVAGRLISAMAGDSWSHDTLSCTVPSPELLQRTGSRWDGQGGFRDAAGKLVFRDPTFGRTGSVLLVDEMFLRRILSEGDQVLLWTVLAERYLVGDRGNFAGQEHVSRVAWLDGDSVRVSKDWIGEYLSPVHTRVSIGPKRCLDDGDE